MDAVGRSSLWFGEVMGTLSWRIVVLGLALTRLVAAQDVPEFVLQSGHSHYVNSVTFSPDGKTLASGSHDNTVKIWDVAEGTVLRTLQGHAGNITSVAFAPDGKTLASANGGLMGEHSLKLWDVATGGLLRTFNGHSDDLTCVAFSPDGKTLASASHDQTVKLWDLARGKQVRTLQHSRTVQSVAFSPDGKTLATASNDHTVKLYDMASGALLRTLKGHSKIVLSVAFSPDGRILASASSDGTAKLWNVSNEKNGFLRTSRLLRTFQGHRREVKSVAFSPDGNSVATASPDGTVRLWDQATGNHLHTLAVGSFVSSVAFSPDGKTVASGGGGLTGNHAVKLWDVASGTLHRSFQERRASVVTSISFSPDGKLLGSVRDNELELWDAASGKLLRRLFTGKTIDSVVFSPDGKTLAAAGEDNLMQWDVFTGDLVRDLPIPYASSQRSVAFSPDGRVLASGGLWDVATGASLSDLRTSDPMVFSPDGKILATALSSTGKSWGSAVKLWDASGRTLLREFRAHDRGHVTSLTFSPDSSILASSSTDRTIKLWDVATGALLHTLQGHSWSVESVAFSPDGATLASASWDHTVKLWDVATGALRRTLTGHSAEVLSVAFSPDGRVLATSGRDSSLRYWDPSDGRALAISYAFSLWEYLTYTPEGYYVASKEAEQFASWRIQGKIYSFEQYSASFHRPDLVARRLKRQIIEEPEVRLAEDRPPELTWLNPLITTDQAKLRVTLSYEGSAEIEDLTLFLNDNLVETKLTGRAARMTLEIPLELSAQFNRLLAVARDRKGLKSRPLRAEFEYLNGAKGPGSVSAPRSTHSLGRYGRKYAVLIGISDYKNLPAENQALNGLEDLRFADRDALAFEAFLKDAARSGDNWEIHRLVNHEATTDALDDVLTRILLEATPRDLVLIFFSGHARSHPRIPGDVYLLTYDFDPRNNLSGFPYSRLVNLIREVKSDHSITFIDACRSGTVGFKGTPQARLDTDKLGERIAETRDNHILFTSASGTQPSWEDEKLGGGHGVFTYFLLEGLKGKAPDQQFPQFVDLGELAKYVTRQVQEHTEKHPKMAPQRPQVWERDGVPDENFPVAIRLHP